MNISESLSRFLDHPMADASRQLLSELGYKSDRTVDLPSSNPSDFLSIITQMVPGATFDRAKALFDEWSSADLLFQLTDENLSGQNALFKETSVAPGLLRSYLFFAVELTGSDYSRTKLTGIVRQLNRLFPMPVMVLIKHREKGMPVLSIAVINRAQNKREASKDVLGKVTTIQGILLESPHRGHLDILESLHVENLKHPQRLPIDNFDRLHAAWEEIFNVELLNNRFYKELSNWFFWALPQVEFPADTDPVAKSPEDQKSIDERRRATSLIRLLTRLIFCWFLKEKRLVPEEIFVKAELKRILKDIDDDESSSFHEAILQNLFYATLNRPTNQRGWAEDKGFHGNRQDHGVTLYRYEGHFQEGQESAFQERLSQVPFLNGGLFECLDREKTEDKPKLYIDGFSRNPKKRPILPNRLFFTTERRVDLSDAYGEPKRKNETVRGLIRLLTSYKFTIVENTPIDQEIALDPELLGRVFENLLASYNSETKTTARKQTGSFYTPRPIVDYIVDESLRSYLVQTLLSQSRDEDEAKARVETLLAYTDEPVIFTSKEQNLLLDAIHRCKILDPACGSGAFPMGMLHKLVHVIHKLDPGNQKWKQLQIDATQAIQDVTSKEAAIKGIEEAFNENDADYGRKLYLIEKCLYGADIQPIAIQITKLRFFISLIVDQRENEAKENRGIRPLPNLETKFVSADTLIALETNQRVLLDPEVEQFERMIAQLYHQHFEVRSRPEKLRIQTAIKDYRKKLASVLETSLGVEAEVIARWDPFDQQQNADFFDPHWMFGQGLEDGFDIVFGNPPYLFLSGKGSLVQKLRQEGKNEQAEALTAYYETLAKRYPGSSSGCRDYYKWFLDRGLSLLSASGTLAFIVPNTFLVLDRYSDIRKLLFGNRRLDCLVVDLGFDVFSVPIVPSAIVIAQRRQTDTPPEVRYADLKESERRLESSHEITSAVGLCAIQVAYRNTQLLLFKHPLAEVMYTKATKTGKDFFKAKEGEHNLDLAKARPTMIAGARDIPVVLDHELRKYVTCTLAFVEQEACPKFDQELHSGPRMLLRKTGDGIVCGFTPSEETAVAHQNVYVVKALDPELHFAVCAILNSSVATFLYRCGIHGQKGRIMAQFRVHALEAVPFPTSISSAQVSVFSDLVPMERLSRLHREEVVATFLEDLIDACVMECYFRDHMAERDLLFHDQLRPLLVGYNANTGQESQLEFLKLFYETVNAPAHPIRNQLIRLTADSPDLLAVIKREGAV